MRLVVVGLVVFAFGLLAGCAEPTQKAAQDSQAAINKEMKDKGQNKDAY